MWAQLVMTLLGIWLMVAPGLLGYNENVSNNAHIVGPLIASFSMIAIWECTRNVRFFNLPLAIWLLGAPLIFGYDNDTALINDYVIAIIIILLFLVKPKRKHRFGGGWPAIWRSHTAHSRAAANRKVA